MNILALSILSISLYSLGTLYQFLIYLRKIPAKHFISLLLGTTAVSLQFIVTLTYILDGNKILFGFFNTASLVLCFIVISLLLFSARKPLQAIFLAIYPISAACIFGALFFHETEQSFSPSGSGIFIHIILSIIAYSVFSIAAIQAILLYIQNNNLKKKNNTILIRNLPPLLTMETLLFEMIWSGTILLTFAIIFGFIFVNDLFAQQLAHKSILSILALAIFATLLIGRKVYGWRGLTASKWTLWGSSVLMIGFFGSKLVLEWFIN
jgi:ABC-type uncharacterized transport system permease subunit